MRATIPFSQVAFIATLATHLFIAIGSSKECSSENTDRFLTRGQNENEIRLLDNAFVEIQGHTIGDEHRSETSSAQFFNSIDQDKDGKLGQKELSNFLMNHIGGMTLDTAAEAQTEAEAILGRLDHNKDDSIDSKDVFGYWKILESLLTVDEVAEWVVHSVQLPVEIGEIFRENHVTGYDFPELVDNEGKALLDELGIEKLTFRKKIVRLVNARMLGIGSKPDVPSEVTIDLEGCSTAILKWKKKESDGFPIHKFRIQRRRLTSKDEVFRDQNQKISGAMCVNDKGFHKKQNADDEQTCPSSLDSKSHINSVRLGPTVQNTREWQNVYDKSLSEFHDFGLELGYYGYQYRLQAWNAAGKSEWNLAEIKQWRRNRCHKQHIVTGSVKRQRESNVLFWLNFIGKFVVLFMNLCMVLFGVYTTLFKLKRASVTSTANKFEPPCPWVLNFLNSLTKRFVGIDIIPQNQGNNVSYDQSVNAVGLFGYENFNCSRFPSILPKSKGNETKEYTKIMKPEDSRPLLNFFRKTGVMASLQRIDESATECEQKESSERCVCSDIDGTYKNESPSIRYQSEKEPLNQSLINERNNGKENKNKDGDYCCKICLKRYKFFKRKRHNCSVCFESFCHKHGKTTHNNFVSCKVPGDCICNKCMSTIIAMGAMNH